MFLLEMFGVLYIKLEKFPDEWNEFWEQLLLEFVNKLGCQNVNIQILEST